MDGKEGREKEKKKIKIKKVTFIPEPACLIETVQLALKWFLKKSLYVSHESRGDGDALAPASFAKGYLCLPETWDANPAGAGKFKGKTEGKRKHGWEKVH